QGRDIQIDARGRAYVTGWTSSSNFPTTADAYGSGKINAQDVFFLRLNEAGAELDYSTYLGGNQDDVGYGIEVLNDREIFLVGSTKSSDYEMGGVQYDPTHNGAEDCFMAKFILPSTPTAVRDFSYSVGVQSISLSWKAPSDDGGAVIDGYKLFRSVDAGSLEPFEVMGVVQSYDDTEVEPGKTYGYSVAAFNSVGTGPLSEILYADLDELSPPDPPRDLIASAGSRYVHLSWKEPASVGGGPITGYQILRGQSSGGEYPIETTSSNHTEYNDTSVANGVLYYYQIKALNEYGSSPPSPEITAEPAGIPMPPRDLAAEYGKGFVHLSWKEPMSDNGDPVVFFNIYRGEDEDEPEFLDRVNDPTFDYNDTNVENGKTYTYQLTSENGVGESPPSPPVTASPLGVPGPPRDVELLAGEGYVNISWNEPEDDGGTWIMKYIIFRGTTADNLEMMDSIGSGKTEYTDRAVNNGVRYHYCVCAKNSVGTSPRSEVLDAMPLGKPDPPTDLQARSGNGYVHLSWVLPENLGGSDIEDIIVLRGIDDEKLEQTAFAGVGSTEYNDTSARNGISYTYAVSVRTGVGEARSSVVKAMPMGPPGIPVNVRARTVDGHVEITWEEPETDGGSPIVKYLVYRSVNGKQIEPIGEAGSDEHYFVDGKVDQGNRYAYMISAENAVGEGQKSVAASVRIEKGSILGLVLLLITVPILIIVIMAASLFFIMRSRRKTGEDPAGQMENTPPRGDIDNGRESAIQGEFVDPYR
ncbi:MAG: fibronectin type III domain-containing protein, partial [Thermoplasmatota archaeon]